MAILKDVELYLMNRQFVITHIIDDFASFIWTDRYNEYGEFEIKIPLSTSLVNAMALGNYIYYKDSIHMMIIEDVRILTDATEGSFILVGGRSLESILDRRIVMGQKIIDGPLENGIRDILYDSFLDSIDPFRKVPNFRYIPSNDRTIANMTHYKELRGDNVYDVIEELCKFHDIGFKITYNQSGNLFEFRLYNGVDRSYNQTIYPYVIFSPTFDNLLNSDYFNSTKDFKNLVLIEGEEWAVDDKELNPKPRYSMYVGQGITVLGDWSETSGRVGGLDLRELYVDASDITTKPNADEVTVSYFINPGNINQTHNGVTITGPGDLSKEGARPEYEVKGTPTKKGLVFDIPILTVPVAMGRGIYSLMGTPELTDDKENSNYGKEYIYILTLYNSNGQKLLENRGGEVLEYYEFSETKNAVIRLSMEIPDAADLSELYGTRIHPQLEMVSILIDDYYKLLNMRGSEELAEAKVIEEFEGDVDYDTQFLFGRDYNIGDIVQVENEFGKKRKSRIDEVSFSYEVDGFKLAPVFRGL